MWHGDAFWSLRGGEQFRCERRIAGKGFKDGGELVSGRPLLVVIFALGSFKIIIISVGNLLCFDVSWFPHQ